MYNKKLLAHIVNSLDSRKSPSKPKDKVITNKLLPFVSTQGYKQGPPPAGTHYRIPSDTIYNPTPYDINAVGSNGEQQFIAAGDTRPRTFNGASYVDEFSRSYGGDISIPELNHKKGGTVSMPKKKGSKAYSRSPLATNQLFTQNPLLKKQKSKKKKVFDPNSKYYQDGGTQLPEDYSQFQSFAKTLPPNLQDPNFQYGNPDQYDLYGMWSTVGKPASFKDVQDTDYFPLQDDGTYHGFTVGSDGEFLKPMSHGTTWKEVMNSQLNTDPYFRENRLIKNEQGRLQYVPNKQDGGPYNTSGPANNLEEQQYDDNAMNAMMKARLAYAHMHDNPSAKRMVNAPDQPYVYTGNEYDKDWGRPVGTPAGSIGTHYMAAFGNYAVPFIQQGPTGLFFNELPSTKDREAIRFDSPEDAQYFSEGYIDDEGNAHGYKKIAPDPSYRGYAKGGFQDDINTRRKLLRDWTYGADIGMLHKAQEGKQQKAASKNDSEVYIYPGSTALYRKINGKWEVDWNRSGNFQPLSKGDIKKRTQQLNAEAIPLSTMPMEDIRAFYKYGDKASKKDNYPTKGWGAPKEISTGDVLNQQAKQDLLLQWQLDQQRLAEKQQPKNELRTDSKYDPKKPVYQNYIPIPEISESTSPFGEQKGLQNIQEAKNNQALIDRVQNAEQIAKLENQRATGVPQDEQPLDPLDELYFAAATLGPGTLAAGSKAINFIDNLPIPYANKIASKLPFGSYFVPRTVGSGLKRLYFTEAAMNTPEVLQSVEQSAFGEKPWEETGQEAGLLGLDYLLSGVRPKQLIPAWNAATQSLKPLRQALDYKYTLNPNLINQPGISVADVLKYGTAGSAAAGLPNFVESVNQDLQTVNSPSTSGYEKYKAGKNALYKSTMQGLNMTPFVGAMGNAIYGSNQAAKLFYLDNLNKLRQGNPEGARAINNWSALKPIIKKNGGIHNLSNKQIKALEKLGYKIEYLD